MKTFPKIALVLALALPLGAYAHGNKPESDTPPPAASSQDMSSMPGMDHSTTNMSGCEMKGMDMSKMSAADHQKVMDQCHQKPADPKKAAGKKPQGGS